MVRGVFSVLLGPLRDRGMKTSLQSRLRPFLFVLLVALAFAAVRQSTPLVWDDSPKLTAVFFENGGRLWPSEESVNASLHSAFGNATPSGYRPLSTFISYSGTRYLALGGSVFLWSFLVGCLIGAFLLGDVPRGGANRRLAVLRGPGGLAAGLFVAFRCGLLDHCFRTAGPGAAVYLPRLTGLLAYPGFRLEIALRVCLACLGSVPWPVVQRIHRADGDSGGHARRRRAAAADRDYPDLRPRACSRTLSGMARTPVPSHGTLRLRLPPRHPGNAGRCDQQRRSRSVV